MEKKEGIFPVFYRWRRYEKRGGLGNKLTWKKKENNRHPERMLRILFLRQKSKGKTQKLVGFDL